ncbi:unnamed protein product [Prorocentrum cordatum]|uniref:DNA-directed DNA polymerase n=1 Tax=Prorocentrum cordatum TaxID=2364126 RepID=A0ABN9TSR5_9DINO|nr:unnamed protein product [Polarella glacialis]
MPALPHAAPPPSPARRSRASVGDLATVLRAGLGGPHGGAAREPHRWREHLRRLADEAADLCDVPAEVSRLLLQEELGAEGAPDEARAECRRRMAQLTEEYEANLRGVQAEFARARGARGGNAPASSSTPSSGGPPEEAAGACAEARPPPSLLGRFSEDCGPSGGPEAPARSRSGERRPSRPGSAGRPDAGGFPLGARGAPRSPQRADGPEGAGAGGAAPAAAGKRSSVEQAGTAGIGQGPSAPQARGPGGERRASMRWVVDSLPRRSDPALRLRRCGDVACPPALPAVSGDYISLRILITAGAPPTFANSDTNKPWKPAANISSQNITMPKPGRDATWCKVCGMFCYNDQREKFDYTCQYCGNFLKGRPSGQRVYGSTYGTSDYYGDSYGADASVILARCKEDCSKIASSLQRMERYSQYSAFSQWAGEQYAAPPGKLFRLIKDKPAAKDAFEDWPVVSSDPLTAMDIRAKVWRKKWSDSDAETASYLLSAARDRFREDPVPTFDLETLGEGVRRMRGTSAKGIEQLGKQDLVWHPEQCKLELVQLFQRSEKEVAGPWQPTVILVTLTRNLQALVRSCLDEAVALSTIQGWAQAGMMWDIEGFCDALKWELLLESGAAVRKIGAKLAMMGVSPMADYSDKVFGATPSVINGWRKAPGQTLARRIDNRAQKDRWRGITGVVSARIATLLDIDAIPDTIDRMLWDRASRRCDGKGLPEGLEMAGDVSSSQLVSFLQWSTISRHLSDVLTMIMNSYPAFGFVGRLPTTNLGIWLKLKQVLMPHPSLLNVVKIKSHMSVEEAANTGAMVEYYLANATADGAAGGAEETAPNTFDGSVFGARAVFSELEMLECWCKARLDRHTAGALRPPCAAGLGALGLGPRPRGAAAVRWNTMLTSAVMHAAVRLGVPDAQCTWRPPRAGGPRMAAAWAARGRSAAAAAAPRGAARPPTTAAAAAPPSRGPLPRLCGSQARPGGAPVRVLEHDRWSALTLATLPVRNFLRTWRVRPLNLVFQRPVWDAEEFADGAAGAFRRVGELQEAGDFEALRSLVAAGLLGELRAAAAAGRGTARAVLDVRPLGVLTTRLWQDENRRPLVCGRVLPQAPEPVGHPGAAGHRGVPARRRRLARGEAAPLDL